MAVPTNLVFSATDVRLKGLDYVGLDRDRVKKWKVEEQNNDFKAHFGSSPSVIAEIWYDILDSNEELNEDIRLTNGDMSENGFRMFMIAYFFLWTKPRNARVMRSRFDLPLKDLQGRKLWQWIYRIAALRSKKIVWEESILGSDATSMYVLSVDGTDFRTWEPAKSHPRYNQDRQMSSHKFEHAAWKYEIGISVWHSKIVWLNGPFKGSKHDLSIFRENGLKDRLLTMAGKLCIADRGYQSSESDEIGLIVVPSEEDPPDLHKFKTRVRLRHEQLNGWMSQFKILSETFTYSKEKHKASVEAVAVIIQYQMDNGSPLYHP